MKCTRFSVLLLLCLSSVCTVESASAQQKSDSEYLKEKLTEISKSCEDQGSILAEAKINKWKKAGKNVEAQFGENAFAVVSKVMHHQCVSIQHVALLRMMKSHISTEEARRMDIDGEVAKLMKIIEGTL